MAAQEYYNPQAYAARQHDAFQHNRPYAPTMYQQYQGSSQQLPYNINDYKPPLPPNDLSHPSQPPPPYSPLPHHNQAPHPQASPQAQYLQPYNPLPPPPPPAAPQYLAPPRHFQPQQHQQPVGYPMKPARSISEPPEDRKYHSRKHHSDRSSRRRSRSRSGDRSSKKDHSNRNTFLGAGGGALIGDVIFPGLGTVGGAILGGLGGREASHRKSRSVGRKERY